MIYNIFNVMIKQLLKRCVVELVKESREAQNRQRLPTKPPFTLVDPIAGFIQSGKNISDFSIEREIPIKLSVEDAMALSLHPDDIESVAATGIYDGPVEFYIEADTHYEPGSPGRRSGHPDTWTPDDPEDFSVDDFVVVGFLASWGDARIALVSKEDGRRLGEYIGSLTDEEVEQIREKYVESIPSGRDPDEYYDTMRDDSYDRFDD